MTLDPMGAQRTRSTGKIHYTPAKYRKWLDDFVKMAKVSTTGELELSADTPVAVSIVARFKIPKSRAKGKGAYTDRQPHTSKPDADNVAKAILDGMVKAEILPDDAQVSSLSISKCWGATGGIYILVNR